MEEDPNELGELLRGLNVTDEGVNRKGILRQIFDALLLAPHLCSRKIYHRFLAPVILDVLEVGKESLSSKLDIAKFLVLVSYAVRFATVKIYVNLDERLSPKVMMPCSDDIGEMSSTEYIKAIRTLYHSRLFRDFKSINMGALYRLAFCEDTSSNVGKAPACRLHAMLLFFESLQLPLQCCSKLLEIKFGPKSLSNLVWKDFNLKSFWSCSTSTFMTSSIKGSEECRRANDMIEFKPYGSPTVSVGGINLPTMRSESIWRSSSLVCTSTAKGNLRRLAQSVSLQSPILVEGESGCGKSFLIKELASLMGKRDTLLELHLDDQTDSKSLLGSYICSDVPGEFVWQPGLVMQAALNGYWLLIEDIDKASLDLVATLTPIFENGKLPSGYSDNIIVHPSFRVFGTRSVSPEEAQCVETPSSLKGVLSLRHFSHSWHICKIEMSSSEDVEFILKNKFALLPPIIFKALLSTYRQLSELNERGHFRLGVAGNKLHSLRDLLKVAERANKSFHSLKRNLNSDSCYITEEQRVCCFADVVDVFFGSIREKNDIFNRLLIEIGSKELEGWKLSEEVILGQVIRRRPELNVEEGCVRVGRAYFEIDGTMSHDDTFHQQFAFTNYSLRLLEKIAVSVSLDEPVLLVGETGTGKTTSVQELATILKKTLVVQNISLSTDSSDLLGGFRPVTMRQLFRPSYEHFASLFKATFSQSQNSEYLFIVAQYFQKGQWKKLLKAFQKAGANALRKIAGSSFDICVNGETVSSQDAWDSFLETVHRLLCNLPKIMHGFAFAFVDGLLVEAMRKGHWVLLDEINLASPETLQALVGLLDGQSLCLTEKGDLKPVCRNPEFRIFAAMNPPTDVGKRELAETLRCRFTEFYVDEMVDMQDLEVVVNRYLHNLESGDSGKRVISDVVDLYLGCRAAAQESLVDGGGLKPHYSLRSLTRALKACMVFVNNGFRPLNRALYEGFLLSFQTQLDPAGRKQMASFVRQHLQLNDDKKIILPPPRPGGRKSSGAEWVLIKPFWIKRGPLDAVDLSETNSDGITRFVMTETVEKNIRDIARAVQVNIAAVLLQGPTSVGKTAMIEFLAAKCGYRCIRINNHEHTDVQEYIGGYVTGSDGRLVFQDGLLVQALRRGDWLILDELNLAPSDVLEALNRLLDDNKELLIPETGEIVRPASGFFLFATQNPAGAYGGRKPLSRAFRNRFIEVSVFDMPHVEIEQILSMTCGIPPKFAKMMVSIMKEMQVHRQQSTILHGRHGAITTRDLIKLGNRKPQSPHDIVREGYMLLAEKHRDVKEKEGIAEILVKACNVGSFDPGSMYNFSTHSHSSSENGCMSSIEALKSFQARLRSGDVKVEGVSGIALTHSVRRLWGLVSKCMDYSEPVLLIGETGTGKTTVCQMVAAERKQRVRIVNCHQSTETADIIGGLRPVRGREGILSELLSKLQDLVDCHSLPFCEQLLSAKTKSESNLSNAMSELSNALQNMFNEKSCDSPSKKPKVSHDATNNELTTPGAVSLAKDVIALWRRYLSLFEWQDGPLVEAMRCGDVFILDEINLAEDAVIERLNSVLENSRTLTLAEKGGLEDANDDFKGSLVVKAHPNFRFLATMNPGDDFGKRELSPALRSRFSEIWVPNIMDSGDIIMILVEMMEISSASETCSLDIAKAMVAFMSWMNKELEEKAMISTRMSIREVLAWARFIAEWNCIDEKDAYVAFVHGAQMLILDGLGIGATIAHHLICKLKGLGISKLLSLCPLEFQEAIKSSIIPVDFSVADDWSPRIETSSDKFSVGPFFCDIGASEVASPNRFVLSARTTVINFQRVLRAMRLNRPILLEGPPGVGKTSLISNLAALSGHKLVRINLSEHSELSDLLGTDLPSPNDSSGEKNSFQWCDGVFLSALKNGDWVLLDELNLAPQSVLEGLNACFDHRGEVFIPEIGKSFHCPPSFRVFCAQNPMAEGGGRKGLPQSFLTRFSRVFIDAMDGDDLEYICLQSYKGVVPENSYHFIKKMVKFVQILQSTFCSGGVFGRDGSPWEFNLRDIFRWCDVLQSRLQLCKVEEDSEHSISYMVADAAHTLFVSRLRSHNDRRKVLEIFDEVFGFSLSVDLYPQTYLYQHHGNFNVMIGCEVLQMSKISQFCDAHGGAYVYHHHLELPIRGLQSKVLESVAVCVNHKWPVLLVGETGNGKRRIVQHLAYVTGNITNVVEFSATPTTDATDLLGSFEQSSAHRYMLEAVTAVAPVCGTLARAGGLLATVVKSFPEGFMENLAAALESYHSVTEKTRETTKNNSLLLQDNRDGGREQESSNVFEKFREMLALLNVTMKQLYEWQSREDFEFPLPPENYLTSMLRKAQSSFDQCEKSCNVQNMRGSFEWVDGVVVKALERGHWLLVDNVNMCSSSVVDRLNSLLEPNGSLLLTESGTGRMVKPHDNFRIFLTMDPTYGEISRAMRNRCVELSVNRLDDRETLECTDAGMLSLHASLPFQISKEMNNKFSLLHTILSEMRNIPSFRLFSRVLKAFEIENCSLRSASQEESLSNAVESVVPFALNKFLEESKHLEESSGQDIGINVTDADAASWSLKKISPFINMRSWCLLFMIWAISSRKKIFDANSADWLTKVVVAGSPKVTPMPNNIESFLCNVISPECDMNKHRISLGICKDILSEDVYPYALSNLRKCLFLVSSDFEKSLIESYFLENENFYFPQHLSSKQNLLGCALKGEDIHFIAAQNKLTEFLGEGSKLLWNNLIQVYHDRLQNRFGLRSLLNTVSTLSSSDNSSLLTLLESFMLFQGVIVSHRLSITWMEEKEKNFASSLEFSDPLSFYFSAEGEKKYSDLSLYSLSMIVFYDDSISDCREGGVLSSLFELLQMIDNLVTPLFSHFVSSCLEGGSAASLPLLTSARELLACRDSLSTKLMHSSLRLSDIPWSHIEVCLQWTRKKTKSLTQNLKCDAAHPLRDMCSMVDIALEKTFTNYFAYWKSTFRFHKSKLWKEGHSSLPCSEKDWLTNTIITDSLLRCGGVPKLPGFVESSFSPLKSSLISQTVDFSKDTVLSTSSHKLRRNSALMKEWLCLYSTFYWCYNIELHCLKGPTEANGSIDFRNLTQEIMGQFKRSLVMVQSKRDESEASSPSLTSWSEKIDEEMQAAGFLMTVVASEPIVVKLLYHVSNLLGNLCLKLDMTPRKESVSMNAFRNEFTSIYQDIDTIINIALQCTLFDVRLFQEAQILKWLLESILFDDRGERRKTLTIYSREQFECFNGMLKSFAVVIDMHLNSIVTSNMCNSNRSIDFDWRSDVLASPVNISASDDIPDHLEILHEEVDSVCQLQPSELFHTGAVRVLHQPVSFELALRVLDANDLDLPLNSHSAVRYCHALSTPGLTLSCRNEARNTLTEIIRKAVHDGNVSQRTRDSYNRLDLLRYFTLSAIFSCREYIDSDELELIINEYSAEIQTDRIVRGMESNRVALLILKIADIKLENCCSNYPQLALLFSECLRPLLNILVHIESNSFDAEDIDVDLSKAWVYIGLIRFKLLVPQSPVDPSLRPAVKADLLSGLNCRLESAISADMYEQSLIGTSRWAPQIICFERERELNVKKILAHSRKVVHRSCEAPSFSDLFDEIREVSASLLDTERVLEMLNAISKISVKSFSQTADGLQKISCEELAWQESISSFCGRLHNIFKEYEDVTSPLFSAIGNISQGIRKLTSWATNLVDNNNLMTEKKRSSSVKSGLAMLFCVPSTSTVDLSVPRYHRQSWVAEEFVNSLKQLQDTGKEIIKRGCTGQEYGCAPGEDFPNKDQIAAVSSFCIRFLILARIEYYIGCSMVKASHAADMWEDAIHRFIDDFLSFKETQSKMISNSSIYQHKEKGEVGNGDEEDLEELSIHFPHHVGALEDMGSTNTPVAHEDALMIHSLPETASTCEREQALISEEGAVSAVVGFQMRKIFVHPQITQQDVERGWMKNCSIEANENSSIRQEFCRRLQHSMFQYLLSSGKSLRWGITNINDSCALGSSTRGYSLLALHSTVLSTGVDTNNASDEPYRWIKHLAKMHLNMERPIDKDMLYLLESRCNDNWNPVNFQYDDSDPAEVAKAADIVKKILCRCADVLTEYPGNEIVIAIHQISAKILLFPVHIPLAKMLASFELLLMRMQEWEQFAARHVSLQAEMQSVTVLITAWRKIELDSWADLLRCKELTYVDKAKKTWFFISSSVKSLPRSALRKNRSDFEEEAPKMKWSTLDRVTSKWLMRGYCTHTAEDSYGGHYNKRTTYPSDTDNTDSFDESRYLSDVFNTVDKYLNSAVVGEFPTRLHFVRLLSLDMFQSSQFSQLSDNASAAQQKKNRLQLFKSYICYGVWQYYEQFLGLVRGFQELMKNPIEQRLKDEIKISRWDQLNTYAVIEHSTKVHRKLNKIIRQYASDVLDYPVASIFQKEIMGSLVGEQGDLTTSSVIPPSQSIFPIISKDLNLKGTEMEVDEENNEALHNEKVLSNIKDNFDVVFSRLVHFEVMDRAKSSKLAKLQPGRILQAFKLQHRVYNSLKLLLHNGTEPARMEDSAKVRFGHEAADAAESFCNDIFSRLNLLRSKEEGKGAPKNVKHRAMTDLLKRLSSEGVSHLRSSVPAEARHSLNIFSLPPLLLKEFASDLGYSFENVFTRFKADSSKHGVSSLLEKGEGYFIRNVCEINQMRAQIASPISTDVSSREANVMLGQVENMFYSLLRSRATLSAALEDLHAVVKQVKKLKNFFNLNCEEAMNEDLQGDFIVIPCQQTILNALSYRATAGNTLLCSLKELNHLLQATMQYSSASESKSLDPTDCLAAIISSVQGSLPPTTSPDACQVFSSDIGLMSDLDISQKLYTYDDVKFLQQSAKIVAESYQKHSEGLTSITAILSDDITGAVYHQLHEYINVTTRQCPQDDSSSRPTDVEHNLLVPTVTSLSKCVDSCLLIAQNLKKIGLEKKSHQFNDAFGDTIDCTAEADSEAATPFMACLSLSSCCFSALNLSNISEALEEVFIAVGSSPVSYSDYGTLKDCALSAMPLLESAIATAVVLIEDFVASYKSIGKLIYVCTRVFRVIISKGFCSNDANEESDGECNDTSKMTFEDDVEGTGMGEGEGKKDVSDQIEDEEQLLGLKGDSKPEEPQPDRKLNEEEEKKGVEMMQEFEGEMCDIPEKDEADGEDEEEEEKDREMGGELDLDNIVDEKQWDAEEDEQEEKSEQETLEDSGGGGEKIDGEMVTNEGDNDDEDDKDNSSKKDESSNQKDEEAKEESGEDKEDGNEINEDSSATEKPVGVDVRNEDNAEEKNESEAATENDGDGDNDDEQAGGDEGRNDLEPSGEDSQREDPDGGEDEAGEGLASDDEMECSDDGGSDNESDENESLSDDVKEGMKQSADMNDVADDELPDDQQGDHTSDREEAVKDTEQQPKSQPPTFGVKSSVGKDSLRQQDHEEQRGGDGEEEGNDDCRDDELRNQSSNGRTGGMSSGQDSKLDGEGFGEQEEHAGQSRSSMEPPNPFRKKGDINEAWHRRLNIQTTEVEEDDQDDSESNRGDATGDNTVTFEYEMESNEKESNGPQVLSEATEKDAVELPVSTENNQDDDDGSPTDHEGMEVDDSNSLEDEKKQGRKRSRETAEQIGADDSNGPTESAKKKMCPEQSAETVDSDEDETEKAPSDFNAIPSSRPHQTPQNSGIAVQNSENWLSSRDDSASDIDIIADEDQFVDDASSRQPVSQEEMLQCREQWSLLTSAHRNDCNRLCEQLRLILEPTLASKLQGDYRTGKRINMRRVIGYVASGFRKDKIWMRRTKPSKRDYQVMMMIDDSSSMGQAGPLAMSALNVVSGALTQLEAGKIGVCSFSEQLSLLHPFDKPFTDDVGARLLSQVKFQATQTRLASALHSVIPLFEQSKSATSVSASDVVLQICFVISDARIDSDNREKVRKIVREMAEKNIVVVLIVIDKNDNENDSIFATKTVEFTENGLVTRGYLDDFPFPYYVAIQEIEALPAVLCDVVKQWFQLVQNTL